MAIIAFLGLGVMGYPMAGHLSRAGHTVRVWNRTAAKAQNWTADYKGEACAQIAGAVTEADFVMMCVGDDNDVLSVAAPALSAMKTGSVLVDHTTASAKCARQCAQDAHAKSIGFMDAPISGGEAGAINGQLTIMCGGDAQIFANVEPVMAAYGKSINLMGPVGAGQLTKMVNQICIAGTLQGLSEAVHFAKCAGLDIEAVASAIGGGAAQSWQMDNRATTMGQGEFDFGFAVDWMRKDLKIALEAAEENGANLAVTRMIDSFYKDVQDKGGNRWDTSSLITRLQD